MPPTSGTNGVNKLAWLILTTFIALTLALGGAWAREINTEVVKLREKQSEMQVIVAERLAKLETKLDLVLKEMQK